MKLNPFMMLGFTLIMVSLLVGILIIQPAISDQQQEGDLGTDGDINYSVTISYLSEGEQVYSRPFNFLPFAYTNQDGLIVDQVAIKVDWSATGTNLDWSTFALSGEYVIEDDTGVVLFQESFSSENELGSWPKTILLDDILSREPMGQDIQFTVEISAQVTDVFGELLEDGPITFTQAGFFAWASDSSFSLSAQWIYDDTGFNLVRVMNHGLSPIDIVTKPTFIFFIAGLCLIPISLIFFKR